MKKIFSVLVVLAVMCSGLFAKPMRKFVCYETFVEAFDIQYDTEEALDEVFVFDCVDWCYYYIDFDDENEMFHGKIHQEFIQNYITITREIQVGKLVSEYRVKEIAEDVHNLIKEILKGCNLEGAVPIDDDEDFGFIYCYFEKLVR